MNVWIDLGHVPQYNFYKKLILRLAEAGHTVFVTVIQRGRLPIIVKKELAGVNRVVIQEIGKHRLNKISALIDANLIRTIQLYKYVKKKKIDVSLSNYYESGLVSWMCGFPSYAFGDDVRKFDYKMKSLFTTQAYYTLFDEIKFPARNVSTLKCLKEWSYLSPNVFKPNEQVLKEYGVKPKEYVFLREVSVGTVNYTGQESGAILNIKHLIPSNKQVLFSLEDKTKRNLYPKEWILLQEPLKDIHSLIYYAAGLVSSGDSMAREAALLGIPSYYLGIRHGMPANIAAAEVADFHNEANMKFSDWVSQISISKQELLKKQSSTINYINSQFIDINEFMYQLVISNRK